MCTCKMKYSLLSKIIRIGAKKTRNLCQIAETTPVKQKKYKTHTRELTAYLSSSKHLENIKNQVPQRFLKRNRKIPDDLYLIDSVVAKNISALILPDINTKSEIVETNPGFGFITHRLLEANVSKIHAYEPTVGFRKHLFELDKHFPNKLRIYNKDFFSIWKLAYQDKYDNGNRVQNMLKDIEAKDWNDDVAMNIIGVLPNTNFIRHLILSVIFQHGIMTHGRCNLYICVPPSLYLQWIAQPTDSFQIYRPSSVLLQIFCDFKLLEKIPRKCFLPWDNHLKEKKANKKKYPHFYVDTDYLYLLKMTFKKPLPVSIDKLQPLWFFTKHLMVSRKNRVIPMLEKWIPGCGWNLIIENPKKEGNLCPYIDIYTRIGDLKPDQILYLFKYIINIDNIFTHDRTFASWPEYSESSFLASMESALLKMEHSSEDALDSNIKDDEHHEDEEIQEEIKDKVIES